MPCETGCLPLDNHHLPENVMTSIAQNNSLINTIGCYSIQMVCVCFSLPTYTISHDETL